MNILSLFDGISCAQLALQKLSIPYKNYFSSEIDAKALLVTNSNFPNTKQLGDINKYESWSLPIIDIMFAGFPCTSLSVAARQKESGLIKGQSVLFWKALAVLKKIKPKYFLFENVASMKKSDRDIISKEIGVEPILINSSFLSAQMRSRLYWTNIPNIIQPSDKNIKLQDILLEGYTEKDKSYCLTATYSRACFDDYFTYKQRQLIFSSKEAFCFSYGRNELGKEMRKKIKKQTGIDSGPRGKKFRSYIKLNHKKTICLTTQPPLIYDSYGIRKLDPIECERLQTVPDDYTKIAGSKTARYKLLGNAMTVDVIAYILTFIEVKNEKE